MTKEQFLSQSPPNGESKPVGLRAKVNSMWGAVSKDDKGQVGRIQCWEFIMADPDIAGLIGNGDAALGIKVLEQMKSTLSGVHSLDLNGSYVEALIRRIDDDFSTYFQVIANPHRVFLNVPFAQKIGDGQIVEMEFHRLVAEAAYEAAVSSLEAAHGGPVRIPLQGPAGRDDPRANGLACARVAAEPFDHPDR